MKCNFDLILAKLTFFIVHINFDISQGYFLSEIINRVLKQELFPVNILQNFSKNGEGRAE